jgi:uncharacterized RDD family membrane protein YckC
MRSCSNCGKENDLRAIYCQACGAALNVPIGAAAETYAGFWVRVCAWLIDWIVVSVGTGIVLTLTFGGGIPFVFLGQWLYEAFMQSSSWQATLGKRAFNMVVIGMNGERISFARATGRYFAKWISALLLGFGFVMVAFTPRKQGLHDMIAETLVVNRAPMINRS